MSDHFDYGFAFFLLAFALLFASLLGCAGNPQPTRPKGVPYPTQLGPQIRVYPLNQVRCLGGGIGGCSWSGRAQDGPAGR